MLAKEMEHSARTCCKVIQMQRSICALFVVAAVLCGQSAVADPVDYGFVNLTLTSAGPDSVTAYYPNPSNPSQEISVSGAQLGPYGYTLSAPTTPLPAPPTGYSAYAGASPLVGTNQFGFCISLTNEISENTLYSDFYVMNLSDAVGATNATNIESLLYLYKSTGGTLPPVLGSNKYQDALTLGIWDVLTENPLASNDSVLKGNANAGNVYFSNPSSANATAALGTSSSEGITDIWLSELSTVTDAERQSVMNNTQLLGLVDVNNGSVQAQSIYIAGFGAPPAPEPGRIVGLAGMCLVGLPLGLVALRRRQKRRAAS